MVSSGNFARIERLCVRFHLGTLHVYLFIKTFGQI